MAEEIADILDRLDRDDAAAAALPGRGRGVPGGRAAARRVCATAAGTPRSLLWAHDVGARRCRRSTAADELRRRCPSARAAAGLGAGDARSTTGPGSCAAPSGWTRRPCGPARRPAAFRPDRRRPAGRACRRCSRPSCCCATGRPADGRGGGPPGAGRAARRRRPAERLDACSRPPATPRRRPRPPSRAGRARPDPPRLTVRSGRRPVARLRTARANTADAAVPLREARLTAVTVEQAVGPGVRTRRRRSRREEILEIAVGLFATRGYHGVSMDDIGAAAGVTGPALYHHFAGKEAMLGAALNPVSESLLAGGRARVAEHPDDAGAALDRAGRLPRRLRAGQPGRHRPAPARAGPAAGGAAPGDPPAAAPLRRGVGRAC